MAPSLSAATSAPVSTGSTPGAALALAMSIRLMLAWACGDSTLTPCAMPGSTMSST